jgi:hypothetical protein
MKKLPPNAERVDLDGTPFIKHTDPVSGRVRFQVDHATALARKPVCARYAKNKTRVAKRGEVV